MIKFEITDAMLDAAEQAYDTIAAIEHDAWCYTAPTRAAITAAIEASGLVEENARLRKSFSALDEIIESNIVGNDGPNRFWVGGVALEGPHADMIFKILRKIQKVCRQALNKDTTND
jgi:hypothetical protein